MVVDIENFKKKFIPLVIDNMFKEKIPGSSFSIFNNESIIYSKGFGFRNLSSSLPYTPETLIGFGSNTKSFTALAIMMLQEEGKITIEDPISAYFPITIGRNTYPIKIKHLLSHSSGIPNLGTEYIMDNQLNQDPSFPFIPLSSLQDMLVHLNGAESEIIFNPGEHFYYFDIGYLLLGEIISKVSGLSYADFIKKNILQKLNMNRSRFLQSDFEQELNMAIPYSPNPDSQGNIIPKVNKYQFNSLIYPAASLISSTNELAKYVMMMMNEGEHNGSQVISSAIIDQLTEPQISAPYYNAFGGTKYCYGWMRIDNFLGDTLMIHGGGGNDGFSQMAYLKNAKIGITISRNYPPQPDLEAIMALCILLGKNPEEEFEFIKRNKHLEKFVGTYSSYKEIKKRKITLENGILFFSNLNTKNKNPLFPKSDAFNESNFYLKFPITTFELMFEIDGENKIHFTLDRTLYHKIAK